MEIEFLNHKGFKITLTSANTVIRETQDALDLMADAGYHDSDRIIIQEHQLAPDFFDLKSGMAGEILQKFSTYRVKLAIVGNFSEVKSKSLRDFIRESNRYGHVIFTGTIEEAIEKLIPASSKGI